MSKPYDIFAHYRVLTQQLLARDMITSSILSHGTLLGDTSEAIIRDLLRSVIPAHYRIETGQLVLPSGVISPQSDVIIFDDVLGAVLGVSEDGAYLIHAETAKVVIEVKRSLAVENIASIQRYAGKLHSAFTTGGRKSDWSQWAIAFRSPDKDATRISEILNSSYDANASVGLLLVLDACISPPERAAAIRGCIGNNAEGTTTDAAQIERLIQEEARPHPALFGRDAAANRYVPQGDPRVPPLLEFLVHLFHALDHTHKNTEFSLARFIEENQRPTRGSCLS